MKYLGLCREGVFFFVFVFCLFLSFTPQKVNADVPDMMINSDGTSEIHNMSQIWVSPIDSNVVMTVWRDFRLGYRRVAHAVSYDEGQTWQDTLITRVDEYWYTDPIIRGDKLGNFYIMTMILTPYHDYFDFNLWSSTDNGSSWSGPVYLLGEPTGYDEDKEFLALDETGGTYDGNMYVTWTRFPKPTSMMFMRSTNGGVSWDDPLVIASPDTNNWSAGHHAFPIVDSEGNVYVFWMGYLEYGEDWLTCQRMVKSSDGGQSFTEPTLVCTTNYVYEASGIIRIYSSACLDVDMTSGPYRGNIYLVVPSGVDTAFNSPSDIIFTKSTDGGDTWSSPRRVNDDPEGTPVYQFHPWIAVNQEGVIIVFFYDQRNDPPSYENFDTYIAFSFDGGETFTTNYRVSDVSSDPDYGVAGVYEEDGTSPIYLCNYIGVAAYYDQVHCTWTDTRDGNQNVYYSNFTIPLMPPRLYSPEENAYVSQVQPSFRWAACRFFDEINYGLEISTDSSFVIPGFVYTDIDTNFFTATLALDETTYFWRAKAYTASDTSEYSDIYSFTVDTTSPGIPALLSPADSSTITDTMPEFSWSEVSPLSDASNGAPVYYNLQVSSDSDFTPGPELLEYSNIYNTSYDIPDALPDHQTYYWRVKAIDEAGNESDWQENPFQFWLQVYLYGDVLGDGEVTVSDAVYLVNYVLKSGPAPVGSYTGDVNCNGETNVIDIVYLVNYLFRDGPEPCSE